MAEQPQPPQQARKSSGWAAALISVGAVVVAAVVAIIVVTSGGHSGGGSLPGGPVPGVSGSTGHRTGGGQGAAAAGGSTSGGSTAAAPKLAAGDCVAVIARTMDPAQDLTKKDCADPAAVFFVNTVIASGACPDGTRTSENHTSGGSTDEVCLSINFVVGHCYHTSDPPAVVSCDSPDADLKPVASMPGQFDTASCPGGRDAWLGRAPGTVMCVQRLG